MESYQFRYKKKFFWKKIQARGHKYHESVDRMDVFHTDGSVTSIPKWSNFYLRLGKDWVIFTQNKMQNESGQNIKLNVS